MMSRTIIILAFVLAGGHGLAQVRDSVLMARVAELAQAEDDSTKLRYSAVSYTHLTLPTKRIV